MCPCPFLFSIISNTINCPLLKNCNEAKYLLPSQAFICGQYFAVYFGCMCERKNNKNKENVIRKIYHLFVFVIWFATNLNSTTTSFLVKKKLAKKGTRSLSAVYINNNTYQMPFHRQCIFLVISFFFIEFQKQKANCLAKQIKHMPYPFPFNFACIAHAPRSYCHCDSTKNYPLFFVPVVLSLSFIAFFLADQIEHFAKLASRWKTNECAKSHLTK